MKTLAQTLGETAHVSSLSHKFRRLGFVTLSDLKQLAVQRGCHHYRTNRETVQDPGLKEIRNEDLMVGLLLGHEPYDPMAIRISGQLLTAIKDIKYLADLSKRERVGSRIHYIAQKGKEVEPENESWEVFIRLFPMKSYPEGSLPHADRYTTDAPRKRMDFQRKRKWLRVSNA